MSYLEMMLKQSPWLKKAQFIQEDVHLKRLKKMSLIHHEKAFLSYDFEDGVYIVTGPRQIGKSTHLKMLISDRIDDNNHQQFLYFNCDLLDRKQDIVALVEEYLTEFPSVNRRFILLDEITSVKDSFLAIKFLIDNGVSDNITYILTGSNTIHIRKTGEYLPGRRGKGRDFQFNPLSFDIYLHLVEPNYIKPKLRMSKAELLELQQTCQLRKHLSHYLKTGGFPRVINEFYQTTTLSAEIFSMYRAWITSEIAKSDKKEMLAKQVLQRCIISLSSDVSYTAMATDSGIGSHNTIYDYVDFLSNAYLISQIYNYDISQQKINFRKNKKIYFNDPFIYAVIEAWLSAKPQQDYDYLSHNTSKSKLIENCVYLKLHREHEQVFFHKSQHEIDFVLPDHLFEVKYQNTVSAHDIKFLKKYPHQKWLITKNQLELNGNVILMPIELFLTL